MKTTFYIASPFSNRPQVRELADYLQEKGWAWADHHDWTEKEFTESEPIEHPVWAKWAVADLHAALSADVFVLLLKGPPTAGAHAEYAARWTAHRPIHAIRQGAEAHLFHQLPGVVWHETVSDFLEYAFLAGA